MSLLGYGWGLQVGLFRKYIHQNKEKYIYIFTNLLEISCDNLAAHSKVNESIIIFVK